MTIPTRREDPPGSEPGQGTPATRREDDQVPATLREGERGDTWREGSPAGSGAWLPPALAERYRVVQAFPARGGEADLYLVEDPRGARFVAKVYRYGIAPKEDILAMLWGAKAEHVVRLVEFGRPDSPGGRWWELIEYVEHASLRELINREGSQLAPPLVRAILRELNAALIHLHALPIEHRDLKPENVLVRTREPLDLVLADFGIASVMDASVRLTDLARTIKYAPPEAGTGGPVQDERGRTWQQVMIVRERWDYWSLGMMLVEILTGRHPFDACSEAVIAHRLATQDVEDLVAGVEEPAWLRLCCGLLRREPKKHWGSEEVGRWLDNPNDPTLTVAEEVAPARAGFRFLGRNYQTREELAEAFAADWDEAADLWRRRNQELRDWLKHDLGLKAVADDLERIDRTHGLDLDAQVFSVIYALDPTAPLRFRGEELSENNLTALSEQAPGDPRAGEILRSLYRSHILQLAEGVRRGAGLAAIDAGWREAVSAWEAHRQELALTVPDLDDARLTVLLAAVTGPFIIGPFRVGKPAELLSVDDETTGHLLEALADPESRFLIWLQGFPELKDSVAKWRSLRRRDRTSLRYAVKAGFDFQGTTATDSEQLKELLAEYLRTYTSATLHFPWREAHYWLTHYTDASFDDLVTTYHNLVTELVEGKAETAYRARYENERTVLKTQIQLAAERRLRQKEDMKRAIDAKYDEILAEHKQKYKKSTAAENFRWWTKTSGIIGVCSLVLLFFRLSFGLDGVNNP
jgi:serine/threonine protein kinase